MIQTIQATDKAEFDKQLNDAEAQLVKDGYTIIGSQNSCVVKDGEFNYVSFLMFKRGGYAVR
jgi:hypothetical protein